jgi:hypothetical protein
MSLCYLNIEKVGRSELFLLRVSLVVANGWEEAFFWPIADIRLTHAYTLEKNETEARLWLKGPEMEV